MSQAAWGLTKTNFAHLLMASAERDPQRLAIATMDDSITYAGLKDLVISFALHMRQNGMDRNSRIALDLSHPIIGTAVTLACSLTGSCWLNASTEAIRAMELRLTHLLVDQPRVLRASLKIVPVTPGWASPPPPPRGGQHPAFEGFRTPDDTWNIGQSSGTTGSPKFMALSEAYVWERVVNEPFYLELPAAPRFFSYFPAISGPGIRGTLRVLGMGGTCIFGNLWEFFGRIPIDCAFGSPGQFSGFMDALPKDRAVTARIPRAVVIGASAHKPFFNRMLRHFERVAFGYASTEASTVCANIIDTEDETPGAVSVGIPRPDTMVQIVDEDGAVLPAMAEGTIRIRTPRHVPGYIGNRTLTDAVFRDGWFHPGDTGYLDDDGALYITGRVTDRVNIGGLKLNPEVLDQVAAEVPGIRACVCFAMPGANGVDELTAAVVLEGPLDVKSVGAVLRDRIAARFGTAARMRRLYAVAEIPRSATGKAARHALAEAARGWRATELD